MDTLGIGMFSHWEEEFTAEYKKVRYSISVISDT